VVGAPGRAADPRVGGELAQPDVGAPDHRVLGPDEQVQRLVEEHLLVERRVGGRRDVRRRDDHHDVGVVDGEQVERAGRLGLAQVQPQRRVLAAQPQHRLRDDGGGRGGEGAEPQRPADVTGAVRGEVGAGPLPLGGEGVAVGEQDAGGRGQPDPAPGRLEQDDVELAGQRLHLVRDRGRRQPADPGRRGHGAVPLDRPQDAEPPIDHVGNVQGHRSESWMDVNGSPTDTGGSIPG
jgi:hypothetical protein